MKKYFICENYLINVTDCALLCLFHLQKYVLNKNIESKVRKPEWREFPAHNVPAPDCRETDFSRDNHLGNGIGGHPNTYQWTVPDNVEQENCVLRIR